MLHAPLILRDDPIPQVVRLTFNRPDKLNALSTPMLQLFSEHLQAIRQDASVRIVILTGKGDRAFVAGADIQEYQGGKYFEFNDFQRMSRGIFDQLESLPKPTIAQIAGYALGGGLEIALCCDLLICGQSAQLGLPEGFLGLSPGGGGTQRLTRAIGKYEAANILLAGRRITGERAHQLGLAADVVKDDQLETFTLNRAKSLLKIAPQAQAHMKFLMRDAVDAPLAVAKTLEQQMLFELYMCRDAQEGIDAFLEKRPPQFLGR